MDDFELDPSRLEGAVTAINAALAAAVGPDPETVYAAGDLPAASSLGELLSHYDYGEPIWNGSLMLLARELAVAAPTTLTVSSQEEVPAVASEYISHFHHGDLVVDGDFGAFDSLWVTGDLIVTGTIEASFLDTFQDLMVSGSVRCRAISLMGLTFVAGSLSVERFAWVHSQGEHWVLGGVRGPCLLGEHDSVEGWNADGVTHTVNLNHDDLAGLATLLETTTEPDDTYAHDVVYRAFEAAQVATASD